ncbi:MAG TPA: tetratricopeptide repeat protein [Aquabacterium sp.]|nr:tetratricopeptide repeat protein [Aquabacterium sp.]
MKLKALIAALAAAAAFAHAADTPGSNPSVRTPSVSDRLAAARKAIEAKDWTTATRELSAAARDEPQNADVHNLLGYSWRKRSNPDITKAFEHYYTALRINPRHKGAHEYIGQAYLMEKRLPEAEKHLAELEKICGGPGCEEYQELSKAIAEFKTRR